MSAALPLANFVSDAWQPGPYSELESQLAAFDRQYLGALAPQAPAALRRA